MFRTEEFVPPEVYKERGEKALWVMDDRVIQIARQLRIDYGVLEINTWVWGGRYKYRGFRPEGCEVGATWSQHRFGRALDCVPKETDLTTMREEVIRKAKAGDPIYGMIRGIELDVGWFHFDVRNAPSLMQFRE